MPECRQQKKPEAGSDPGLWFSLHIRDESAVTAGSPLDGPNPFSPSTTLSLPFVATSSRTSSSRSGINVGLSARDLRSVGLAAHCGRFAGFAKTEASVLSATKTPHGRTWAGNNRLVSAEIYNEWATLDSNQ